MTCTLTPAYGRDYKTAKAACADFADNKDFILNAWGHPDDGRYINREQLTAGDRVTLRFKQLTRTCQPEVTW